MSPGPATPSRKEVPPRFTGGNVTFCAYRKTGIKINATSVRRTIGFAPLIALAP
jgi:hypothetical protein